MDECMILASIGDYFSASWLFDWVSQNASYLMVFILMTVESSFIPFPSEVVVPPVAFLSVSDPSLNVVLIVLVATAGSLLGALINYYLSMWIGRPIVYKFAESRLGHACLLNKEKVERAEKYFDKHGAMSTFIGRLIPAVRQLISIPAGLSRMNIWKFMTFTTLGALVWNTVLGSLGFWLGHVIPKEQLFETVEKYNSYFTIFGLALGGICLLYILWQFFKPRNKKNVEQ